MSVSNIFSGLTLLLVEDDMTALRQMELMLKKRFRKVYCASNGKIGLNLYHEAHPDIVITDLKMPLMSGIEMSREIRHTDRETPIIVLTALSDKPIILEAIDVGINKYIIKPLNIDKILEALDDIVGDIPHLADAVITSGGIISDKEEQIRTEDSIKQSIANILKRDTAKGPKMVRVKLKGKNLSIYVVEGYTKIEESLLYNEKNSRMIMFLRETFYWDRKKEIEESMQNILGLPCVMDSFTTDISKKTDIITLKLKIFEQ